MKLFMNSVIIIMKARSIIMILNKILETIAYNLDDKKRRKAQGKRPEKTLLYRTSYQKSISRPSKSSHQS